MALYYVQALDLLTEKETNFWCETDLDVAQQDNFLTIVSEQMTMQVLAKDNAMTLHFANMYAAVVKTGLIARIFSATEKNQKAELAFVCEHKFSLVSAGAA
jgi:hypothetical protein